ncbi:uncharacterized protein LOC129773587 isoform X9 [Toxorhynchites rutilus septentrionalis]|uniref:uncharacterized protein LOC129773587 isoform X9 n=1 Tax=Toxorhynchites rutilus septentrionalis TaxID=329112 RepID=UPI0024786060|nr:uncharacterized protein LOC129773587 isoform X9 [Toxorhynchites rutilus septentrionalis]
MGLRFLLLTSANDRKIKIGVRYKSNKKRNMEGSGDGSPQSSMCMVKAAELFPKPVIEKEDESLTVQFTELAGESVRYLGHTDDGVLALSNYRLFLAKSSTGAEMSVPLGLIESTQIRDLFHLIVSCKDASTVKCSFSTSEQCAEWQRRISLCIGVPETLEALFAFPFHAWASEPPFKQDPTWYDRVQRVNLYDDDFRKDVQRLQFDLRGAWRISTANSDFQLCNSYPKLLLVPACISDDTLENVAGFRSSRRIPAVVWRHEQTGAVIARSSQPEVGWLGWRNSKDEQLLKALSDACAFDRGTQGTRTRHNSTASSDSNPPSPEGSHEEVEMEEPKKILIVDARSYASAVTNRARGGGCECPEYYPSADIQFMNLGNIHAIRRSFHALRALCSPQPDVPNWLSSLERTNWFQHLSGLLTASMVVCHAIERCGRPVLVHCSDGWDRTPQIVATAQLCLDPYYRTIEGFRVLVEREWLSFGHKFADRCGHGPGSGDTNERCPAFLQWLDCVHQIHRQYPCHFEFNLAYLIKLAQHSHSCLFGTFLCNTVKERLENSVPDRTYSVWPFLSNAMYRNHLYVAGRERVLWPAHSVRDIKLWTDVYLGSWGGNQSSADYPANAESLQEHSGSMTKTRSYGDLMKGVNASGMARRSSDPNMVVEPSIMTGALNISQENSIDSNISDREISPDLIDRSLAEIQHTTQKLQSLTQDLNQSDEELENSIKNTKRSGQQPTLRGASGRVGLATGTTATAATTTESNNASSLFINGNSECYNFQPIVPEKLTSSVAPGSATPSPPPPPPPPAPQNQRHLHHLVDEIDENTSRIVKIESYLGDVVDGRHHGTATVRAVAKPIAVADAATGLLSAADMMESVDLSGKSPSPPTVPLAIPQHSTGGNLWHGSVETSTDTLVPLDQYSSPKRIIQLSESSAEEPDCNLENSISLALVSNGKHDHKDLKVSKDFETSTATATQTGDSNGCDQFSDSKDYARNTLNQDLTGNETNQNATPKEQTDSRMGSVRSADSVSPPQGALLANGISNSKLKNTPNEMEESIIIQPQFRQLEINGKTSTDVQQQQQQQQGSSYQFQAPTGLPPYPQHVPSSHYQPQNQRRRRNSSNSKNDMSPNKPTNGSVSPSATNNSRFSTPGARSLPLTPPSVPFPAERPPFAATSCPDGLAHALSEQNLRLQQIVHDHRIREEALHRELQAARLELLKKTCVNCRNLHFSNEDPVYAYRGCDEEGSRVEPNMHIISTSKLPNSIGSSSYTSSAMMTMMMVMLTTTSAAARGNRDCSEKLAVEEFEIGHSTVRQEHHPRERLVRSERLCAVTRKLLEKVRAKRGFPRQCSAGIVGYDDSDLLVNSMVDSMIENASNCSWEAVDERSAPSSGANSSQQIASSVLWVPDHAVSRCTTCQTEFWLGRRKHHCRSCGQIFCADCSEYSAPLPDEKLFQPVRLCAPCYQSVSERMTSSQQSAANGSSINLGNSQYGDSGMNGSVLVTTTKQHNAPSSATTSSVHVANNNCVSAALLSSINTASASSLPSNLEANSKQHVSATVASTSCSASANSNTDRGTCKTTTATN